MDATLYTVTACVAVSCGLSMVMVWFHQRSVNKQLRELRRIVADGHMSLHLRLQLVERSREFVEALDHVLH